MSALPLLHARFLTQYLHRGVATKWVGDGWNKVDTSDLHTDAQQMPPPQPPQELCVCVCVCVCVQALCWGWEPSGRVFESLIASH